jgi:glycosyltransferase involved in cell wall biosynthesis
MFVHAHWMKSPFFRAGPGRGVYARYHRLFTRWNATREKRAYRSARHVVALSDLGRESLIAQIGVPPDRITVIRNGVDPKEFRPLQAGEPNALRAELGVPDDTFLILFVGEINTPRKNLDLLLNALGRLGDESHLVVAGAGKGSDYPAMARSLGVAGRVHFLGERRDVAALVRCADVFAFASHYETCGLVVLEALASGVPVITAPSVGASDVIRDGQNGFLLRSSSDREGLVSLLRRLAADPKLAARAAQAGRATAVATNWHSMSCHYEQLYEQILAEPLVTRHCPPGTVAGSIRGRMA